MGGLIRTCFDQTRYGSRYTKHGLSTGHLRVELFNEYLCYGPLRMQ